MRYSSGKEIDDLVRRLVRDGWRFRRGGRHGRLLHPYNQRAVIVPCTPGDRRAWLNFRQDVKKANRAIEEREVKK